MKLEGLNRVLVRLIVLTPLGDWWSGSGFWMIFEFGEGFIGGIHNVPLDYSGRAKGKVEVSDQSVPTTSC